MATGGLYGNSPSGILSYFTWFIFIQNGSQPATPTGGTWNFLTNVGTPPVGWANSPAIPTTQVWMSMAVVSSQSSTITWSSPTPWASVAGVFSFPSAGIVSSTGAAWSTAYTTSGSGTVIPLATSPSIATPTFTGTITGAQNRGAITYGNLSYNDVNLLGTFQQSVNGPTQFVVQNTNAGATASANYIAVNNISTATTNYAEFGINSSGFTGTGSFNQPNYAYLTSTTGDLAIGTTTANAIHFVVNSGATDALTISSAGAVTIPGTLTATLTGTATNVTGTVAVANGGTGSTNAPAALVALGERTSATGSIILPVGTTAQRDAIPGDGYFRYNSQLGQFEGRASGSWTNIGGAFAGSGANTDITSWSGGALAGLRNRLVNGAMAIDQEFAGASTTFTAAAALKYAIDQWYGYCTGANVTGQRVAGTAPNQFNYQFTGAASVTKIGFAQRMEATNTQDLAGTTATLSVDLANTLLTTVTWTAWRANTADTFGTLASPTRTQIGTGTFTVTGTLTRYSAQITVPAAATTGIEVEFSVGAQTSGTFTIGRAQLEQGGTATAFESTRPFSLELLLCQRYFWALPAGINFQFACPSTGGYAHTFTVQLSVRMRATPTIVASYGATSNVTTLGTPSATTECVQVQITGTIAANSSAVLNSMTATARIP